MINRTNQLDILIIIAHPDDESMLFAGTCVAFAKEKKSVGIICATKGEKGNSHLNKPMAQKQLAEVRAKELKKAAEILHIKSVEFLNYQDGKLVNCDINKLTEKLKRRIEIHKPKIVLTFGEEGVTGHNDHICIGKATIKACRTCATKPKEIWCSELPKSIIRNFNRYQTKIRASHKHYHLEKLSGRASRQLYKVNIKPFQKFKLRALAAHTSQTGMSDLLTSSAKLKNLILSAEYFKILK